MAIASQNGSDIVLLKGYLDSDVVSGYLDYGVMKEMCPNSFLLNMIFEIIRYIYIYEHTRVCIYICYLYVYEVCKFEYVLIVFACPSDKHTCKQHTCMHACTINTCTEISC